MIGFLLAEKMCRVTDDIDFLGKLLRSGRLRRTSKYFLADFLFPSFRFPFGGNLGCSGKAVSALQNPTLTYSPVTPVTSGADPGRGDTGLLSELSSVRASLSEQEVVGGDPAAAAPV